MSKMEKTTTLTGLPCEVIGNILRQLGDVDSLLQALLSCRTVYEAFNENPPKSIAFAVLANQIQGDILPYAIATHLTDRDRSGRWSRAPREAWDEVVDVLHGERPFDLAHRLQGDITLADALRMGRRHTIIEEWSTELATSACSLLTEGNECNTFPPPSAHEMDRVRRAFYRAELYSNIFSYRAELYPDISSSPRGDMWTRDCLSDKRTEFFSRHSPWVNEQLACVHDFLERKLALGLTEVAANDIDFGAHRVDWMSPAINNDWKRYYLSLGLFLLHRLSKATTFDEMRAMLPLAPDAVDETQSLAIDLSAQSYALPADSRLIDLDEAELAKLRKSNDAFDGDDGPFEAWFWVHKEDRGPQFIYLNCYECMRSRGYVFWDRVRIHAHDVLGSLEDSWIRKRQRGAILGSMSHRLMHVSFSARRALRRMGRAGYWTREDGSFMEEFMQGEWPRQESIDILCGLGIERGLFLPDRLIETMAFHF